MDAEALLIGGIGFRFAPIYVGHQHSAPGSQILTAAQGKLDGANAAQLALEAGFPKPAVCT